MKFRPLAGNGEPTALLSHNPHFDDFLVEWDEMIKKYENNEITKEALQDWKANYPDSLKKDYAPFEESNVKFCRKGITAKIPPDIK